MFTARQSCRVNAPCLRVAGQARGGELRIEDVELSMNQYSGTVGMDQLLKDGKGDSVEE